MRIAILALCCLLLASPALAGTKTFTASETLVMGEKDSKDGVRRLCLDRARRAILEQAGVYLESTSTVKDLALDKDELRLFSAAFIPFKPARVEFTPKGDTLEVSCSVEADVDPEDVKRQVFDKFINEEVVSLRTKVDMLSDRLNEYNSRESVQKVGYFSKEFRNYLAKEYGYGQPSKPVSVPPAAPAPQEEGEWVVLDESPGPSPSTPRAEQGEWIVLDEADELVRNSREQYDRFAEAIAPLCPQFREQDKDPEFVAWLQYEGLDKAVQQAFAQGDVKRLAHIFNRYVQETGATYPSLIYYRFATAIAPICPQFLEQDVDPIFQNWLVRVGESKAVKRAYFSGDIVEVARIFNRYIIQTGATYPSFLSK
ncbi:MAG: hypothetical protein PWQ57_3286 [Desulfovibrionales bacterium]|nr:hypothetical protein [Desulfovibrionales bacterium]